MLKSFVIITPLLLLLLSLQADGQGTALIQDVRLGNIKASVTNYGKHGGMEHSAITYDEILANPNMVCDKPGCLVTHFTLSVVPKGADFLGPFSTAGAALTENNKTGLVKLKEAKAANAKMIIDSIEVNCGGANQLLKGLLVFTIK